MGGNILLSELNKMGTNAGDCLLVAKLGVVSMLHSNLLFWGFMAEGNLEVISCCTFIRFSVFIPSTEFPKGFQVFFLLIYYSFVE